MKATDLMIGDLINGFGVVRRVTSIFGLERPEDDGLLTTMVPGCEFPESNLSFRPCYARPIPLTAEILEANSWEKVPQPGRANPYHWQLSKYEDDKEDDAYLLYRVKAFETFFRGMLISISVPACEDISFRKQVEHVHELQHALRLCGIEKEIEL